MYVAQGLCACITALFWCNAVVAVVEPLDFADAELETRYRDLVYELRCPKCQNQNLHSSDAPIANDLRREVRRLLNEGQNNNQIIDFVTARYGDFILYRPRYIGPTTIIWVIPSLLLLAGIIYLWRFVRQPITATTPPILVHEEYVYRPTPKWSIYLGIALGAILVGGSIGLYLILGSWNNARLYQNIQDENWRSAEKRLKQILLTQPHSLHHTSLLGKVYFEMGQYALASESWRTTHSQLPAGSKEATAFYHAIQIADKMAGQQTQINTSTAIKVHVRMAAGMTVNDQHLVYVFARATDGVKVPLAVTRISAAALPTSVTLDDSMAMIPSRRLSSFNTVQVVARVSTDGDAIASSGDQEGESGIISLKEGKQEVNIVIGTTLP